MNDEYLSSNGFIYTINFIKKNDKLYVRVYGTPDAENLRQYKGLEYLPLVFKESKDQNFTWRHEEKQWVPEDICVLCNRLVKNLAFL